jgi:hypothetical protein
MISILRKIKKKKCFLSFVLDKSMFSQEFLALNFVNNIFNYFLKNRKEECLENFRFSIFNFGKDILKNKIRLKMFEEEIIKLISLSKEGMIFLCNTHNLNKDDSLRLEFIKKIKEIKNLLKNQIEISVFILYSQSKQIINKIRESCFIISYQSFFKINKKKNILTRRFWDQWINQYLSLIKRISVFQNNNFVYEKQNYYSEIKNIIFSLKQITNNLFFTKKDKFFINYFLNIKSTNFNNTFLEKNIRFNIIEGVEFNHLKRDFLKELIILIENQTNQYLFKKLDNINFLKQRLKFLKFFEMLIKNFLDLLSDYLVNFHSIESHILFPIIFFLSSNKNKQDRLIKKFYNKI